MERRATSRRKPPAKSPSATCVPPPSTGRWRRASPPRGREPRRVPPAAHPAAAGRVTGRRQARKRGRRLPTWSPRPTLPRCGSPRRAFTSWLL
ncbi:hypothetical protein BU14_0362s0008 [Porphyra umbilicalis]|uniref:Uncharacterized protein n=1 Tax=Porphyra umbilicalis TaxID=2786 RepID=A0A1X6NXL5_PORUM|nr:hypothetical protein BU14_0362s0008 [Porphyra umbilicalis]|eukprot:OSX73270.1 hypothetical protein BU14_0362s0008 [Porphyra umbilicalis]